MALRDARRRGGSTVRRVGLIAGGALLAAPVPVVAAIAIPVADAEMRARRGADRAVLDGPATDAGAPEPGIVVLADDGRLSVAAGAGPAPSLTEAEVTSRSRATAAAAATAASGRADAEAGADDRRILARRLADGRRTVLPTRADAPTAPLGGHLPASLAAGALASLLLLAGGGLLVHRRLVRPLATLGRLLVERADPDEIRAAVPGNGAVAELAARLADVLDDLAARRAVEHRLALVASRTSNAVAVTDASGRVEWANVALRRLLGDHAIGTMGDRAREAADPRGRPLAELLADRREGAGASVLATAIERGEGGRGELLVDGAGDGPRWLGVDVQPIDDDDGVRGFVVVLTDLTAERGLRHATEATSRELKAILDAVPSPVMYRDARGRLVRCNAAAARLLGAQDAGAVEGRAYADLAPDHAPAALAADRQVLVTGDATWGVPERFEAADGSRRLLRVDRIAIGHGAGDGAGGGGVLAVATDVTDRRRLESRLEVAMRAGRLGVWEWEPHRGAMTVSSALRETLGGELEAVEPTFDGFFGLLHEEDRGRAIAAVDRAVSGDEPGFRCEVRLRRDDGGELWALLAGQVAARGPDGRAERVVGVLVDIEGQKREQAALADALERAEAAGRARTAFLASISHELRTPLTAILGYGELLNDPACGEPERLSHAETILRNGRHLLSIIDDVLDMSRIEAGRLQTRREPTDLGAVLRDVLDVLQHRADARGLELRAELDGPVPLTVETDAVRLRQVVLNLVGNAIKFTARGEVRIRVGVDPGPEGGEGRLRIVVADTGPGIPPDVQARLFRPFERADDAMNRTHGGTGLGLAISRRLARMLDGDILLESEPGRGSVFTLEVAAGSVPAIPAVRGPSADVASHEGDGDDATDATATAAYARTVDELLAIRMRTEDVEAAGASPAEASAEPHRPLEGRRILLAEDGPDNRRLISHHLRAAGAIVDVAEDGAAALDLVRAAAETDPYDLVVMDMQMPRVDGYEATRRLREEGHELPVVALTAHAMTGDRERCLAAGCTDYATKPIDRRVLIARCAELSVRARRARRAA